VLENVPALLAHEYMGQIFGDLAACGFDIWWDCIPAAAVGAPHRRDRVFIVTHTDDRKGRRIEPQWETDRGNPDLGGDGPQRVVGEISDSQRDGIRDEPNRLPRGESTAVASDDGPQGSLAHAEEQPIGPGLCESESGGERWGRSGDSGSASDKNADPVSKLGGLRSGEQWGCSPVAASSGRGRNELRGSADADQGSDSPQKPTPVAHGTIGEAQSEREAILGGPGWWATEPDVGRVAHGVPSRVDRLRALGNAVVPQVAEYIGKLILNGGS
jgi:DNA (cytosine-5)-methyltransferase 1